MHQIRINFAKDYHDDSYYKTHLMRKKLKGQRPINHIKKTLILKNMWNCKTLKIQRTFQN